MKIELRSINEYCKLVLREDYNSYLNIAYLAPFIQNDMRNDWRETRNQWSRFITETTNQDPSSKTVNETKKDEVTQFVIQTLMKYKGRKNHGILNKDSYFLNNFKTHAILSAINNHAFEWENRSDLIKSLGYDSDSHQSWNFFRDLDYEMHIKKVGFVNETGRIVFTSGWIPNDTQDFDGFILNDLLLPKFQEK